MPATPPTYDASDKFMTDLHSPLNELYRVGETTYSLLKKLGLETVQDLLFYFPFRYDDFTKSVTIAALQTNTEANVIGTIDLIQNKKSFKRRMFVTEALVSDETDSLKVIWFNQPFLAKTLKVGDKISLAGRVSENYGQPAMISPNYEKIYSENLIHTQGLIPNYHLTADLTQKQIRFFIKEIINLADTVPDWLPADIKSRLGLLNLSQALKQIHFPENSAQIEAARQRLGFAELFLRQLKAQMIKRDLRGRQAPPIEFKEAATREFVSALPFKLTDAQRHAAWEILRDLKKDQPMSRLLEGDVGSGKTLVVALAVLNTVLNKKQVVIMAPTEILAHQHFQTFSRLLAAYDFKISLMVGGRGEQKERERQKLKNGSKNIDSNKKADSTEIVDPTNADIIIGTHALIQAGVRFKNLALAVVDEQHRFGVAQRQRILDFNSSPEQTPHFLSLTATPIPRSLALTVYGDLDLSIINQMPSGRKPTITKIIPESGRRAAYDFIRTQIKNGHQAFVICPLIDASDRLGVKSVKNEHQKLDQKIFPELSVGLLHGRLKAAEKEKVMTNFADGRTQILVATSMIEVGLDMPNATIIIIEGAERFGLAQLHQFRGRVGRSAHQAYCFLFPSNEELTNEKTIERLGAMTEYHDGFSLAKIDLKLRGAGELYGLSQSGFPELQIASLFSEVLIKKARDEAGALINADPDLKEHPLLRQKLGDWEKTAHLE